MGKTFIQDPDEVLDYTFDFTPWLASGESIATATVTADDGLSLSNQTDDGSKVTVFVDTSGAETDKNYRVIFQVTTDNNPARTFEGEISIRVRE